MNVFHYLFYFIYSKIIKYRNRKDAVFYTTLGLAVIEVFLLFVIAYLVEIVTGFYYGFNELEAMLLYWFLAIINSYYFYKGKKYIKINTKYKNQTDKQKQTRGLFVLLLVLFIMVLFFLLASLRSD